MYCYMEIDREVFKTEVDCEKLGISGDLQQLLDDPTHSETFFHQIPIDIDLSEQISEIQSLICEGLMRRAFLESQALELFYRSIVLYNRNLSGGEKSIALSSYDLQQIDQAKSILENNLRESITIETLAKTVGLNEQKLKSGFKKIHGSPIKTYLKSFRLEKAKALLIQGNMSISEVAEEIGYKNRGYFSRIFRDKYGVLPKDYVKSLKTL